MQIPSKYIRYMSGKSYVRGFVVISLISRYMEENGVGTKGTYLEISRAYYDSILLSDKVKLIRLEYDNAIKEQRKKLKYAYKKMRGLLESHN